MNLFDTIAIIMFVASLAVVITGASTREDDAIGTGMMMLVFTIVCCSAFQVGAIWQRADWVERFEMKPIVKEAKP